MHVLWIGKTFPFCGNVTYTKEISKYLTQNNNQFSLVHFSYNNSCLFNKKYSHISLKAIYQSQLYTIPSFMSTSYIFCIIKALAPDIIHISLSLSPIDLILPQIAKILNIPVIATFHPAFKFNICLINNYKTILKIQNKTIYNEFQFKSTYIDTQGIFHRQLLVYKFYIPFLYKYSSIIVFSRLQFRLMQKLGLTQCLLYRIPNGVNYKRYEYIKVSLKEYLKCKCIFLYQGRISPEKNLEKILKVWVNHKMGINCKLLIIGNGPLVYKLMHKYKPEQGFIWMGCINNELRKINLIKSSNVFLLSSLIEGLSISLLESMSSQLACISTNSGSSQTVLRPDNGILISYKKLISQLEILLPLLRDNNEIRRLLSKKSRKKLIAHYSLYNNINKLTNLYNQN
uniref:Glycosyl transferase n=1 Tax=Galdieria sulphuraria TaxID=130081 RepID=A0A075W289_GALSU|nr:glycosyl transferase [Galdieria sulphuraria]AIG92483.1 glycosyl transferase [Galdieria sulphuraria]